MSKGLLCVAVGALALMSAAAPAEAASCGHGTQVTPSGRCVPVRFNTPGGFKVGHYYKGRGWWDGRRFRAHRYRSHGEWRYR